HVTAGVIHATSQGRFVVVGGNLYAAAGAYALTVTITDKGGATATVHGTASVTPGVLTASPVPVATTEGASFSRPVATFTDSTPGANPSWYTVTINWGDGKITTGAVAAVPGGFRVLGQHAYATAGSYAVNVQIASKARLTASAHGNAAVADA